MLILKRKLSESIVLDRDIRITVLRIQGNAISLGIEAPSEVGVRREELSAEGVDGDARVRQPRHRHG